MIDARAVIDNAARLAEGVSVGPYSVIGANVEIGPHTTIGPHVVIKGHTKIGAHNKIFQFASVGEDPQDKKYQGEETWLEIGDHNIIRECCTINRGTRQGDGATRIGNHNLLMAYVHIAHDCIIKNETIFGNNASLAGHVTVENYAILSGFSLVHQFCTIGEHSFIAAATGIGKDVLPYLMVSGEGHEASVFGLNTVGLRRRGFSETTLQQLKRAYKIIFRQNLTVPQALEQLQLLIEECPEVEHFMAALRQSQRGIVR